MTVDIKCQEWLELRADRLGRRFDSGATICSCCAREMWFTDFETIPEFRARVGAGFDVVERPGGRAATLDHVLPPYKNGPKFHNQNPNHANPRNPPR